MNQHQDQWQGLVSKYELPDHSPKLKRQIIEYLDSRRKKRRFLNILILNGFFVLIFSGSYLWLKLTPVASFFTQTWLQLTQFYLYNFYPDFFWGLINFTIITTIGWIVILGVIILVELGLQVLGD